MNVLDFVQICVYVVNLSKYLALIIFAFRVLFHFFGGRDRKLFKYSI